MCAKFPHQSRLKYQHTWGEEPFEHLITLRIFTLIMNKTFIQASNFLRKMATDTIWNWQSWCTDCVFCILARRSVCRAKCAHWRPAYLRGTSWDPYASSMKQIALKLGDLLTLGVGLRFVHQAMWHLCLVQDSVLGTLNTCNAHSQWCTANEQYWPMG